MEESKSILLFVVRFGAVEDNLFLGNDSRVFTNALHIHISRPTIVENVFSQESAITA